MPSDLTERLAARLEAQLEYIIGDPWSVADIIEALPLLLSEPELVAGLPDAVRHKLLLTLVAEQSNIAETYPRNEYAAEVWNRALHLCPTDGTPIPPVPDEVRLSVLTPRELMALELGLLELDLSKAEAKALTPEVPCGDTF